MLIKTYKTKKVAPGDNLIEILNASLPRLPEKSILVITSKIVALCQNRVVKITKGINKHALVTKEADYFVGEEHSKYGFIITIKNNVLIMSAGIDESNGNGYYVLWPEKLQSTVNTIWRTVAKKNKIRHVGIIISDSKSTPLRWGTNGVGIAYCGFKPLNDYRNKADIYGRLLKVTQVNVLDGLSVAGVLQMGDGNEQTPLAVITDVPFVQFQDRPPTKSEVHSLSIDLKDDIYAPLIDSLLWKKGQSNN